MFTYHVAGVRKTTTKNPGMIVLALLDGTVVSSLTRDDNTLKQCEYDVKRLGWTNIHVFPFEDGGDYTLDRAVLPSELAAAAAAPAVTMTDLGEVLAADTRRTYKLDIVSGMYHTDHSTHVHRAGCRDAVKAEAKGGNRWEVEVHSVKEIVLDSYGPAAGSFFEEAGYTPGTVEYDQAWTEYVGEFKFFACVAKGLPTE